MGNKLWALALVGAAAYLFKTKKGNELRKQMTDAAGKAAQQLKEKYQQSKAGVTERLDAQTA
jgi:gas vesicle protein